MKSMLKEDWITHPDLKKWRLRSCVETTLCSCKSERNHVEINYKSNRTARNQIEFK